MASEALSADNVGALRVVDLKEELKTRGLATDGKKVRFMRGKCSDALSSFVGSSFARPRRSLCSSHGGGGAEGPWEANRTEVHPQPSPKPELGGGIFHGGGLRSFPPLCCTFCTRDVLPVHCCRTGASGEKPRSW